MDSRQEDRTAHPIVDLLREEGRTQTWLARKIGRSAEHTNRVLKGVHPATGAFRAACALALGRDESELFHPADTSIAPPSEDGAVNRDGTAAGAVYADGSIPSRRSA